MRRFFARVAAHEPTVLIVVGALLGVATGYGAILCRLGIGNGRQLLDGHRLRRRLGAIPEEPRKGRRGGGNHQGDQPFDLGIVHGKCPLSGTL